MAEQTQPAAAVASLQRFYAAESTYLLAAEPDFGPVAVTLDPECVIYQPDSLPYGGEWRGHDGFEAWIKAFASIWSSLEVKEAEIFPLGDIVVSRSKVYARARANQHETTWPLLQFFRIREGRILELRPFYWDTAALVSFLDQQL